MARGYTVYIDGTSDCPHDPGFEHRMIFGYVCVPKDFSERTGRSRTHKQTETVIEGLPWKVWLWAGGCDAAGVTARKKVEEWERRDKSKPPIILDMGVK